MEGTIKNGKNDVRWNFKEVTSLTKTEVRMLARRKTDK